MGFGYVITRISDKDLLLEILLEILLESTTFNSVAVSEPLLLALGIGENFIVQLGIQYR